MSTRSKEETLPLVVHEAPRGTNHKLLGLVWVGLSALSLSLLVTTIKFKASISPPYRLSSIVWILNLVAVMSTRTSLFVPDEVRIYVAVRCGCGFVFLSCATWGHLPNGSLGRERVDLHGAHLVHLPPAFDLSPRDVGRRLLERQSRVHRRRLRSRRTGRRALSLPVQANRPSGVDALAIISALVAALAKAAAFVLLRYLPTLHYLVAIHYLTLTCSLFSGIWIALDERVFHYMMDLYAWLGVGAIGVLGFLGEIGLTKGAHVENVGLAFLLRYLGVVLVFVWDALLLREVISPWSVVGAVVTLVFVGIIAWRRRDRPSHAASSAATTAATV
ncbi:hypothetical protein AC1031_006424 [Aphanomyces cochlioides]|nr:hypothetical protein AC1031_006424 [Aphanomyces cochlioides]